MMRVVVSGLMVAAASVFSHRAAADPIKFHPSVAIGVAIGTATEVVKCSTQGSFTCPLPSEAEHGFGFQAAPSFEALVMAGRSTGFRLGLGVRYLSGFALDNGGELHFALVPEAVGRLSGKRLFAFARFFNTVSFGFPDADMLRRQQPVLDACASLRGVDGAHCSTASSRTMFSLGLELGLMDRFESHTLRYGLGFQTLLLQNHAVADGYSGSNPEDSDDDLYATYDIESSRFVAHVGIEW